MAKVIQYRTWLSIGVVIILAAAVIVTGVLIQKRGEHERLQGVATTTSKSDKGTNSGTVTAPSTTEQKSSSSNASNTNPGKGSTSTSSSQTSSTSSSTTAQTSSATNQGNAATLPDTGPKDTLMSFLAVMMVSFVVVSYVRSRRTALQAARTL